jgi:hypothetical protein
MRKFVIIAVILGLGITLLSFSLSNDFDPVQPAVPNGGPGISGGICFGLNLNLNSRKYTSLVVRVNAGLPIKSHLVSNGFGTDCLTTQPNPGTLNIFKSAAKTWQFYADWLIWSAACFAYGCIFLLVLKKKMQKHL